MNIPSNTNEIFPTGKESFRGVTGSYSYKPGENVIQSLE
jgi:hypothetical protein